uniref:NADH dehydrogenase subunit 6 n=1 Tax=Scrobicularia plana TaxID=665965 RepID=A0A6H2U282_9BIVA|nr:NADH dehydrogenase subunit 6 [Scrobicularia plana]
MLVLSSLMWLAKHPLSVGAIILLSYMIGSVVVGVGFSFVVGVFLFLTGVSGMMVAFLYVVALCPNPVFVSEDTGKGYYYMALVGSVCVLFVPLTILISSYMFSFSSELGKVGESYQWLHDPSMFSGLAELMPFLGVLLFLCMVSVVVLCGQQKQCLGGHSYMGVKRTYS